MNMHSFRNKTKEILLPGFNEKRISGNEFRCVASNEAQKCILVFGINPAGDEKEAIDACFGRKIMRRIIPIILFLVFLLLTITGCGSSHTHKWVEASCIAPKHCEECGQTIGEPIGHDWKEAICTEPKMCRRCGLKEGEPLGHNWEEATCTESKTCARCGVKEGPALGHDIVELSCTEGGTCRRCGESIDAVGHIWTNATCTEPKTCSKCGETEGSAIGHVWNEATCTVPKKCSICGKTEGSELGHNWIDATCTEPRKCSRCGSTDGGTLGHSFSEGKCSRCGSIDPNYTPPETYESNRYYDIVEEAIIKNSIGYTIVIQKVIAKQDASIEATLLASDANGDIVGKSSDRIILTAGKPNYFRFSFDNDISKATIQSSWKYKEDSILVGERNAVEMVKYNQSGRNLYITFKQTGDEIGSVAQYKLLFYKDNQIVDCDYGYFSIRTENLNGKGSTDVASIMIYGIEYDRIEYIFEP